MPAITYVQQFEPRVQSRVRARFAREMEALAALGFRELGFYSEQLCRFSAIIHFPILLLMLIKREVLTLDRRWLRASASFVLMHHRDPPTIALPMGMGVKLYTGFVDGAFFISSNFHSHAQAKSNSSFVKYSARLPLADAWALHQQRVRGMEADGKRLNRSVDYDHYVQMSRQEESGSECTPLWSPARVGASPAADRDR